MPAAAYLQPVFRRIEQAMAREHRAARRAFILEAADRYARDSEARARTLQRLGIGDGNDARVISLSKERLESDRLLRQASPYDPPAPIRRWTLLAVWIGERRLTKQTRAIARRIEPLQPALAAE
jgi:hypothetical protein